MYKVLVPEAFYPEVMDNEGEPSAEALVDINEVLNHLYGYASVEDFEKVKVWVEGLKWSIRNKAPFENEACAIGEFVLKVQNV
jgi:hypothetical protein